jgi:LCP family protein required for cell wall assembly
MKDSSLLNGRISRRNPDLSNPSQPKTKTHHFRRRSHTQNWQDPTLVKSVISSASPIEPLGGEVKKPKKRRVTKKRVFATLAILLLIVGGSYLYNLFKLANVLGGGNPFSFLKSTKLRGEDSGKVNIMLIGTSEGDPQHPGEDLTDSIMVISYDVKLKKALLISIPRDIWVTNKYASGKINSLYHYGNSADFKESGYYEGGIGLLQKELQNMTGLQINYYSKINYNAFKDAVDALGGIDIDIQGTDSRGIYDPNFDGQYGKNALKLKNGQQTLNGTQALLLARARNANGGYGLAGSDYDRAANQRKMLIALKDKALGLDVFTNPAKISELTSALDKNIKTDIKPEEARRIYELSKEQGTALISLGLTSDNALKNYDSTQTGQALIPKAGIGKYYDIQELIKEKFNESPTSIKAKEENPQVVTLNAGASSGKATLQAARLPSYAQSIGTGNALINKIKVEVDGVQLITLNNDKPNSKTSLLQDLPASEYQGDTSDFEALYPKADFIILVGKESTN